MIVAEALTRRRGFTLLELLVVIAMLTLLVGFLLPSLQRGREQAREVQCKSRLRGLYQAQLIYLHDYGQFSPLNKEALDREKDEGAWQYNYLIRDGACTDPDECDEFDYNFGPLVQDGMIEEMTLLFCPVQEDPFHSLATAKNHWPPIFAQDTRAGYGRRYHLSGKRLSHFRNTIAIMTDLIHLPEMVLSAHKTGVNAVYTDGHVRWVLDPGILTDNEFVKPFDSMDNGIMEDIWDVLDEAK